MRNKPIGRTSCASNSWTTSGTEEFSNVILTRADLKVSFRAPSNLVCFTVVTSGMQLVSELEICLGTILFY